MQRIRLKYSKGEEIKFISHLDLIRLFERAIRRSEIPISYSHGFNPRMKIDFGPALKVGLTAVTYLDLFLEKPCPSEWIKEELNKILPEGLKILEAQGVDLKGPSIQTFLQFNK